MIPTKQLHEKQYTQILTEYNALKHEVENLEYQHLQQQRTQVKKERMQKLFTAGLLLEKAGLLDLSENVQIKLLSELKNFKKELENEHS